ncbi:hypothetical protein B9Z19DRAFT_1074706 [Tuber borchii]|uniref:Uncharacterized protein n=1 Tax=Tuber borchii TaxID=42251 RepID=A0A2T7A497_TUBBO|nr:hypothetical protein B9Z19DRAFT_1074706 [Tuber borchii]
MTGRKKGSKERPSKRKNSRKKSPPSQTNYSEAGPSTEASPPAQRNTVPSNIGAQLEHTSSGDGSDIAQESNYVLSTTQDSRPRIHAPQALPSYPRTLVGGVYYVHNPNALPEPLNQGYLSWARAEREAAGEFISRHPGAARWNNRTLRYWRLATDFSRFLEDSEGEDADEPFINSTDVVIDDRGQWVSAEDHQAAPRPTFSNPIPQRPYTAPPHHCDYIP